MLLYRIWENTIIGLILYILKFVFYTWISRNNKNLLKYKKFIYK